MGRNGRDCKQSGKWKNDTQVYQKKHMLDFFDRFLLIRSLFLDKENAVDHIFFWTLGKHLTIVTYGKLLLKRVKMEVTRRTVMF